MSRVWRFRWKPEVPCQGPRRSAPADLTFGDYVRLFQHPDIWPKLGLRIDGVELTKLLTDVRTIRNDMMHFDPDPMTNEELGTLKRAVRLLQEL